MYKFKSLCAYAKLLKFYMPKYLEDLDKIFKLHLIEGLKYFFDELKYLYWHAYTSKTLQLNLCPKNFIELNLPF